jgi:hypothetical protein
VLEEQHISHPEHRIEHGREELDKGSESPAGRPLGRNERLHRLHAAVQRATGDVPREFGLDVLNQRARLPTLRYFDLNPANPFRVSG